MKAVLQRVDDARVVVDGRTVGQIGTGILVLLGVLAGDTSTDGRRLAERVARFRMFPDETGKMNRGALDEGHAVLVVSQFTLAADGRKGRRPSFDRALAPELAEPLYLDFVAALRELGLEVATGEFGALMRVELANAGPVTFVFDEPKEAGALGAASAH